MFLENVSFITSQIKESPRFFRKFTLDQKPEKSVLNITGLGLYTAFINGKKAGDSYLSPGFNDYDGYLRYQELEVTDLLIQGENIIEVYLGNGWYKGRFGLMSATDIWGKEYLLAVSLQIDLTDGSRMEIVTDENWNASESCIRSDSIYDGEVRDDSMDIMKEIPCLKAGSGCKSVQDGKMDLEGPEGRIYHLVPEMCPPIRAKIELKPELIISPKGERILDFGQNMAGIVRIHSRLKKGDTIHLTFGEILIDGCFCNSNYRDAVGGFTYTSDGVEKNVEPMFTFFGFRYAKVEISAADGSTPEADPDDFTALVLYTDLKETIHINTSNEKLNRLLQNALWGQRSNFLDVPTDCPQRNERLGWTGDAQVFADTACFNMNCEDFYQKFLKDLRYDQVTYLNGDIPMFSPCMKDGAPGGPAWADAAVIIPWTMYQHYGNIDNLRESYPMMKDYMEVLIARDAECGNKRIISTGHCFGDWLALDGASPNAFKGGTDDIYIMTVYYYYCAKLLECAAKELGYEEDSRKYSILNQEIKHSVAREFFSPSGRLCIDTQTGYALAIYFDLYTDWDKIKEGFRRRLSMDRLKLKTGFVGTGFLLKALFKAGMDDYACRMLFSEEFPGWLYAVNMGATTIWERWNSVMPDGTLSPTGMNSLNHYSYGAVASTVYTCIAGLNNADHGWKKAVIEPHISYRLKFADMAFDSPAGTWKSAWKICDDGHVHVSVTVPEGARAVIRLPDHPRDEKAPSVSAENGIYEVGQGTYEYDYMPVKDYFHPYDGNTFIADIAEDENAVKALKDALPGVFDAALAQVKDNQASNLAEAIFFSPVPDLPQKIDQILRTVVYRIH